MNPESIVLRIPAAEKNPQIVFLSEYREVVKHLKIQLGKNNYLLVTDQNVYDCSPHFFDFFEADQVFVLPAGEATKQWKYLEEILAECFESGLNRKSYLVAVGGGVIGDITGFAASTFLRGIKFVQVPTSLLAMVDASVGGKTGINNQYGKNLVGSFHHPEVILMGRDFLTTLPETEIKNGLAEMIKHGIIQSEGHFLDLLTIATETPKDNLEKIWQRVPDSVRIKKAVVESDPEESHERMKLNLGHTFGHAVEKLSKFAIPHGRAVAIGTVMATEYALKQGLCSKENVERIRQIFLSFGVDLSCPFDAQQIWAAMKNDKKRDGDKINLILPRRIGMCDIFPVKF